MVTTSGVLSFDRNDEAVVDVEGFCLFVLIDVAMEVAVVVLVDVVFVVLVDAVVVVLVDVVVVVEDRISKKGLITMLQSFEPRE